MISTPQTPKISKIESVKAPIIESEYLTYGKVYLVIKIFIDGDFLIKDDNNKNLFCRKFNCGHLNGKDWILNN